MKIGDKVVCVDDRRCSQCRGYHGLVKNSVYVVKEVRNTPTESGSFGVMVIGASVPKDGIHTGFFSQVRFRLLDEMKKATPKALKPKTCYQEP